LKIFSSK
jgi:hypothetical protein